MLVLRQLYTLESIDEVAAAMWNAAGPYRIITLSGDLGAGKTTLVSHLCRHLGIEDAVSSPTFALVNEYELVADGRILPIYHIDWYRLKNAAEGFEAGMEDYLHEARQGRAVCIIEWPEKAAELLAPPYVRVNITVTGPEEREMEVWLVGR